MSSESYHVTFRDNQTECRLAYLCLCRLDAAQQAEAIGEIWVRFPTHPEKQARWHMPVVPATQGAEAGRSQNRRLGLKAYIHTQTHTHAHTRIHTHNSYYSFNR